MDKDRIWRRICFDALGRSSTTWLSYIYIYIYTLESSYKNPASERKSIDGEMSRSNEAQRYPPSCLGTGDLEGIQNKRNLGLNKQLIEEMDNSSFL